MAGIVSVSRTNLRERRKKLRRQRQKKIIQTIWQTTAVTSLTLALFWVAIQPIWMLTVPEQIVMKSENESLSTQAVQSLLSLSYPQSLWRIEPTAIAKSLKQQPIIADAIVNRRLFPPGLIIEIKERVPVAIAQFILSENNQGGKKKPSVGLLDESGVLIPLEKYTSLNPNAKLPTLKVIGSPEQYRPYWAQLYQAISQNSIEVMEIDFQNPSNLILKTELGNVHLGVASPQISEQFKVMAQMRHLPTKLNPTQIQYIDLKNPEFPLVQMNQNKAKINSKTP